MKHLRQKIVSTITWEKKSRNNLAVIQSKDGNERDGTMGHDPEFMTFLVEEIASFRKRFQGVRTITARELLLSCLLDVPATTNSEYSRKDDIET